MRVTQVQYNQPGRGAPQGAAQGAQVGTAVDGWSAGISSVRPQNPATKQGVSWGLEQWFSYIFTHGKTIVALQIFKLISKSFICKLK